MPKKDSEFVSVKAGSAASKVQRNPKSSKVAKSAAGSALTQRPNKTASNITKRTLRESAEIYSDALERLAKR